MTTTMLFRCTTAASSGVAISQFALGCYRDNKRAGSEATREMYLDQIRCLMRNYQFKFVSVSGSTAGQLDNTVDPVAVLDAPGRAFCGPAEREAVRFSDRKLNRRRPGQLQGPRASDQSLHLGGDLRRSSPRRTDGMPARNARPVDITNRYDLCESEVILRPAVPRQ